MKRSRDYNSEYNDDIECVLKYQRMLDPPVQCFAVPELIENIVKHLVKYSRTILRISQVSKLHFNLINDKAMWIRFGFPAQHFNRKEHPDKILYQLLKLFYIDEQKAKKQRAQLALDRVYRRDSDQNFFKFFNDQKTPTEQKDFITNNYITEEASLALLNITRGMQYCSFSLSNLIRWLEQDPRPTSNPYEGELEELRTRTTLNNRIENYIDYYKNYTPKEGEMKKLFHSYKTVNYWERYQCTVYHYMMEDPKKRVIFIFTYKKHFVIKIDISKNLIEICGDLELLMEAKFNNECVNTFNYLCEVDRSETDWKFLISNYRSHWSPVDNAGPFIYKAYPTSFFENITFVHPFKVRPY